MGGDIFINATEVAGIYSAIIGMRNPKDSWAKSDTSYMENGATILGDKDIKLAKSLVKAGSEHSKFLRQIQVWADFHMPRYWWQEADTYHFGTKNSASTMHTITKHKFEPEDFFYGSSPSATFCTGMEFSITALNLLREYYLETQDFNYVLEMKRLLPEAFIQLRTWNTNYAEILNIYNQRKGHRLQEEWVEVFCSWAEELPYFKEICL